MLECDICFQPADKKTETGKVLCGDCYEKYQSSITLTPIEACIMALSQLKKVKLTEDIGLAINELEVTIDKYTN